MSKFCAKCGMELKDDAVFCPGCGAKVEQKEKQPEKQGVKKKSGKNSLIGIGCIGIIVLVLAIFGIGKAAGSGCEKPIKIYQQAINKVDFGKMQDALAPGIYESEIGDISDFASTEDLNAAFKSAMESEIGDQLSKLKLKVVNKEKIDSKNLESALKNRYYIEEEDAKKAKAAYNLTVEASGFGENYKFTVVVVKIDGKWKMAEFPIFGDTNYVS